MEPEDLAREQMLLAPAESCPQLWFFSEPYSAGTLGHQHIGLYAYRRDFLLQLSRLPQSGLEKTESLEQLRALEAGYQISVAIVDESTCGIDTPEDYQAFVARQKSA